MADRDYLQIAKDAYASSTSYLDSNFRKKWEDSINMFNSKHPADSKYNSESYKHRSKIFRPKTRSMIRKHEAAAAAAFFSNVDVISTDAVDQSNVEQVASAALWKEVLNYRLTKTIPWFQILVGGVQDAMTVGVVCSYQYWEYREREIKELVPVIDEMTGQQQIDEEGMPVFTRRAPEVLVDKPCIDLIPAENVRIDPGASWIDPIASSPYVIRLIPMYVTDVKTLMDKTDSKTNAPKWKKLTDGEMQSAMKNQFDSTRQVREGKRQDSKDQSNAPLTDFEIVWVHENFLRLDGEETVYYTLGTEFMLTDPKPLKEVYFHGERPMAMGCAVIETHKVMPSSPAELGEQLQREANEVVNQRLDNVKLVLNKRFIAKRGAQVDLKSLVRNVAGSVTLATDPVGDVRTLDFQDVTSSSYAEQDRINVDYDELTGNFSQGSVMTNRKMGETVGGMAMISGSANQLTEYTIRTITETWVERVLRQLIKLEQAYETDEVIMAIAADRAKLMERYGINEITDSMLNQDLTLTVNVGMGATDPNAKLGKFIGAVKAYGEVAALNAPGVDISEIGKEIFGLAGYKDGRRFMVQEKENAKIQQVMQQAQQMVQQAQQELAQRSQELDQQEQTLKALQGKIENDAVKLNGSKNELALKEQLAVTKIQSAAKSAASELSRLTAELENSIAEVTERMASLEIATDADVEDLTQLFAQVILGQERIAAIINEYGTVQ
jgi:hypothetical protein